MRSIGLSIGISLTSFFFARLLSFSLVIVGGAPLPLGSCSVCCKCDVLRIISSSIAFPFPRLVMRVVNVFVLASRYALAFFDPTLFGSVACIDIAPLRTHG